MQKGKLILTPGVECQNSSTEHYSVFAVCNKNTQVDWSEEREIFSSPHVSGALFMQHHMMEVDSGTQHKKAYPRAQIQKTVQAIHDISKRRVEQGGEALECIFDAEPAPVQRRRYFDNPHAWPDDEFAQVNKLSTLLSTGQFEDFLRDVVDRQEKYPLLPSNQTVGAIALQDRKMAHKIAYAIGEITGRVMGSLGINVLYAPVCDVGANAFPERCYGENREIVIELSKQWVLGALSCQGIDRVCLKHAPGHGVRINSGNESCQDTHNALCFSDDNLSIIREHMQVFTEVIQGAQQEGVAVDAIRVMTNHILYRELDPKNPVSSSDNAISYIQEQLPEGIKLIADCVNMASFADSRDSFIQKLDQACRMHEGGVIATTHFVKTLGRKEMLEYMEIA